MKKVICFFFLISVFTAKSSSAQQTKYGSVTYRCIWTVSYPITADGMLCFSLQKSFFVSSTSFKGMEKQTSFENVIKDDENGAKLIEEKPGEYTIKVNKQRPPEAYVKTINDPFNIYTDLGSSTLRQLVKDHRFKPDGNASDEFLLQEQLGSIQWTIEDDTKQIGNFKCQKASCRFRGRDYTAWFTPEIPVCFGPWKLNGLPGLILEVSDSKQEVIFFAVEINIDKSKGCDFSVLNDSLPKYHLKDYVYFITHRNSAQATQINQNLNVMNARMPEGTQMELSKAKVSFRGLQLEYEY